MSAASVLRNVASLARSSVSPTAMNIPDGLIGEFERVDSDVGPLWFPISYDVMRPSIAKTGTWEKEEGDLLRSLARHGVRFLDIGANVGYFTLMMAKEQPSAVIASVEPHPITVQLLRMNLWEAGVTSQVFPVALTAGDRSVVLETPAQNLGDTRSGVPQLGQRASMVSAGISADALFGDQSFDLVKLDVQGFEPDVLQGMQGIIARSPGLVVVSEFWPGVLRSSGRNPLQVLESYQRMGFDIVAQIGSRLDRLSFEEIVLTAEGAGPDGALNLVLRRS
jgi:FkbM family methyltransferase